MGTEGLIANVMKSYLQVRTSTVHLQVDLVDESGHSAPSNAAFALRKALMQLLADCGAALGCMQHKHSTGTEVHP